MKAYIANGVLLSDLDCAVVYGNYPTPRWIYEFPDTVTIKCELLTNEKEIDVDVINRKANVFLHFDHHEFDPTANTELYNSIEVEFSYNEEITTDWEDNETGKHCKDLYVETKNRNYKMEHLSSKVQEEIISSIHQQIDEYLKEQND